MSDRFFEFMAWGVLGSLAVIWLVLLILEPPPDKTPPGGTDGQ